MPRQKLLVSTWIGGLVTAGGTVATLVLSHFGIFGFSGGLGLVVLVHVLGLAGGILLALGWVAGAYLGKGGTTTLAILVMFLLAVTLPSCRHVSSGGAWAGIAWAATMIGCSILGWSLGSLESLSAKKAEDQG